MDIDFILRFMSQTFIDKDALVPFLVMQSAPLFDVNRHQSCDRYDQHGDESGELSQRDGEHDKSNERHPDSASCK